MSRPPCGRQAGDATGATCNKDMVAGFPAATAHTPTCARAPPMRAQAHAPITPALRCTRNIDKGMSTRGSAASGGSAAPPPPLAPGAAPPGLGTRRFGAGLSSSFLYPSRWEPAPRSGRPPGMRPDRAGHRGGPAPTPCALPQEDTARACLRRRQARLRRCRHQRLLGLPRGSLRGSKLRTRLLHRCPLRRPRRRRARGVSRRRADRHPLPELFRASTPARTKGARFRPVVRPSSGANHRRRGPARNSRPERAELAAQCQLARLSLDPEPVGHRAWKRAADDAPTAAGGSRARGSVKRRWPEVLSQNGLGRGQGYTTHMPQKWVARSLPSREISSGLLSSQVLGARPL